MCLDNFTQEPNFRSCRHGAHDRFRAARIRDRPGESCAVWCDEFVALGAVERPRADDRPGQRMNARGCSSASSAPIAAATTVQ